MFPAVGNRKVANWIDHILQRNGVRKCFIEGRWKRREDGEEEVSSYRMAVRNGEYNRISNRNLYVALSGEAALEKVVDLLRDRQGSN